MLTVLSITPKTTVRALLRRGLRVTVTPSERVTLRAELLRGRRVLARRTVATTGPRRIATLLRLGRTARRSVGRSRSRVTLTLRLRAVDPSGNATVRTRRLRLRP